MVLGEPPPTTYTSPCWTGKEKQGQQGKLGKKGSKKRCGKSNRTGWLVIGMVTREAAGNKQY